MATILPATYKFAEKWSLEIDAMAETPSAEVQTRQMIFTGLRQITNMISGAPVDSLSDHHIHQIVDLLARQTLRVKTIPSNVSTYIASIQAFREDAKIELDAKTVLQQIEHLRVEGYQDEKVFPRNPGEITQLIDAKRHLKTLRSIFEFIRDVQLLSLNPAPKRSQVEKLMYKAQEYDKTEFHFALDFARDALKELDRKTTSSPAVRPIARLPEPYIEPKPSCPRRAWSMICFCTGSLFHLANRVAGSIFSFLPGARRSI